MARIGFATVILLNACRGVHPTAAPMLADCQAVEVFTDGAVPAVPYRLVEVIFAQCAVDEAHEGLDRARQECRLRLCIRARELGGDALIIEAVEMLPREAPSSGTVYPVDSRYLPRELPAWEFDLRWRARVLRYSDSTVE